jgi:hypothetical protein
MDGQQYAVEFLKDFNKQTKEKAAGDTRELSVDGHLSHYGFEFLRLARLFRIQVMSYNIRPAERMSTRAWMLSYFRR